MQSVTVQTLQRLPLYLHYLKSLPTGSSANISATALAEAMGLGEVQVRKDLASVSDKGKPKIGYSITELIADMEHFLGYDDAYDAVVVGAGHLGCALLSYEGFRNHGLDIVAAFDVNEQLVGTRFCGKPIFAMEKLSDICRRMQVHIGILTVPASAAQAVCDTLVDSGILAIWNFAPVRLQVPPHILVQNENMASSLALLSRHLNEQLGGRSRAEDDS